MTLWRWKNDPNLNFPAPAVIRGVDYNNLDAVDAWMEAQRALPPPTDDKTKKKSAEARV
jgi:hypothetical protein